MNFIIWENSAKSNFKDCESVRTGGFENLNLLNFILRETSLSTFFSVCQFENL